MSGGFKMDKILLTDKERREFLYKRGWTEYYAANGKYLWTHEFVNVVCTMSEAIRVQQNKDRRESRR
jgi:hypothetical protein